MNSETLMGAVAVGLGATLVMDLWGVFLRYAFRRPAPDYCLVGRWLCYMREGVFRHAGIARSAPKPAECAAGWFAHYLIGVVFAFALVASVSPRWLESPTLTPALAFGIVTVVFPFFVMQPSFGLGIASSKTPNPARARLRSLMNHAVFGFGLYVSARIISSIF